MLSANMMNILSQNICNLIEVEKEDKNVYNFEKQEFDLLKVIHQAFDILRIEANEKQINLEAKIGQKSDLKFVNTIYGNQERFLLTIVNLISHALKFTNQNGMVSVVVNIDQRYLLDGDQESYKIKYSIKVSYTSDEFSPEQLNKLLLDATDNQIKYGGR